MMTAAVNTLMSQHDCISISQKFITHHLSLGICTAQHRAKAITYRIPSKIRNYSLFREADHTVNVVLSATRTWTSDFSQKGQSCIAVAWPDGVSAVLKGLDHVELICRLGLPKRGTSLAKNRKVCVSAGSQKGTGMFEFPGPRFSLREYVTSTPHPISHSLPTINPRNRDPLLSGKRDAFLGALPGPTQP